MEEVLEDNCLSLQRRALRPTGVEQFQKLVEIIMEGVK